MTELQIKETREVNPKKLPLDQQGEDQRSTPRVGWHHAAAPSTSTLQERTCGRGHTKNTPALVSPCMESSLAVNCTGAMWIVDVKKLLFSSAQQRWGSIWTNVSTHTLPSPIGMLFPIGTCSKEGYQDGHRPRAHDLEGETKVFKSSKEEAEWSSKILQPFTILADSTTGPVNINCSSVNSR